jgi:phosphatidylserine/phosphatidylglycerophosphate/cardiolipin synthase-like enzyme
MGIEDLNKAVARIALEVHPNRIDALCGALASDKDTNILAVVKRTLGAAFSPQLIKGFAEALTVNPKISVGELAAMFRASSATASLAVGASSVELVWTGPATGMVPIRHTAQVLTGLIDEARDRLFLVSFVAYHVGSVVDALQQAIKRGVQVRVLLEQSKEHGGNVTVDSFEMLRSNLPGAHIYEWDKMRAEISPTASVHAKCAVADGVVAFVTSANLSEAAMERNMEVGILVRGGFIPGQLDRHLNALITARQLAPL